MLGQTVTINTGMGLPPGLFAAFALLAPQRLFGLAVDVGGAEILTVGGDEFPTGFSSARKSERNSAKDADQQDDGGDHCGRLRARWTEGEKTKRDDERAQQYAPDGRDGDRSQVPTQPDHVQRVLL